MLGQGASIQNIALITGLSPEEIEKYQNQLANSSIEG